jgi:hypothetical protein
MLVRPLVDGTGRTLYGTAWTEGEPAAPEGPASACAPRKADPGAGVTTAGRAIHAGNPELATGGAGVGLGRFVLAPFAGDVPKAYLQLPQALAWPGFSNPQFGQRMVPHMTFPFCFVSGPDSP